MTIPACRQGLPARTGQMAVAEMQPALQAGVAQDDAAGQRAGHEPHASPGMQQPAVKARQCATSQVDRPGRRPVKVRHAVQRAPRQFQQSKNITLTDVNRAGDTRSCQPQRRHPPRIGRAGPQQERRNHLTPHRAVLPPSRRRGHVILRRVTAAQIHQRPPLEPVPDPLLSRRKVPSAHNRIIHQRTRSPPESIYPHPA